MYWKILILTFILVAIMMLALGVKLLFDKNATFTHHSCGLNNGESEDKTGCASCGIQELANCDEKKK